MKENEKDSILPKDLKVRNVQESDIFYLVGIGASAGGLESLQTFFANTTKQKEVSYVIIQHLAQGNRSYLPELLGKQTELPMIQVNEDLVIEAGNVYIISPNTNIVVEGNKIKIVDRSQSGINLPIDIFFKSLAENYGHRALGVILSGTGFDGAAGVGFVSRAGGVVFVENPGSAQYEGMPSNAINSGYCDFILPSRDIPPAINSYINEESAGKSASSPGNPEVAKVLPQLVPLLGKGTNIDFSNYKADSIIRNVHKRMTTVGYTDAQKYLKFIHKTPQELENLKGDLLIGVTAFFRDKEAFESLDINVIPKLFENTNDEEEIRIWCEAVSTGQEPYSIAILVHRYMEEHNITDRTVKIFATDIDERAIRIASAGVYPESIKKEIDPDILEKYFILEGDRYVISRQIKDLVLFSPHDLLSNPPFNRINLIVCRNLLIYIKNTARRKILSLFHYSLKPHGHLFLGAAEFFNDFRELYKIIDSKRNIYQKINVKPPLSQLPGSFILSELNLDRVNKRKGVLEGSGFKGEESSQVQLLKSIVKYSQNSGLFLDFENRVVLAFGKLKPFFIDYQTDAGPNFFKVIPPFALGEVNKAIMKLRNTYSEQVIYRVNIPQVRKSGPVNIRLKSPVEISGYGPLILVFFEDSFDFEDEDSATTVTDKNYKEVVSDLKLRLAKAQRSLESSSEELQQSNEELLSSNEELQSSNEELQCLNEELFTLSSQMQEKNKELIQLHDDMTNLLRSIDVGSIFLDLDLKIRKFTDAAQKHFNIMEADIGRPLDNFTGNIGSVNLKEKIDKVIRSGSTEESEIRNNNGKWYQLRMVPYHTRDSILDGLVITFLNVDKLKKAERKLNTSEAKLRATFNRSFQIIAVLDFKGKLAELNNTAAETFKAVNNEILGKYFWEIPGFKISEAEKNKLSIGIRLAGSMQFVRNILTFELENGKYLKLDYSISPIYSSDKEVESLVFEASDITDKFEIEGKLSQKEKEIQLVEKRYKALHDSAQDGIITANSKGEVLTWNKAATKIFEVKVKQALGSNISSMFKIKEHPEFDGNFMELLSFFDHSKGKNLELTGINSEGESLALEVSFNPWEQENQFFYSWIVRDVSSRKESQNKLKLVYQLGKEITQADTIEDAFDRILETVAAGFNFELGEAWMIDDKKQSFNRVTSFCNNSSKALKEFDLASNKFNFQTDKGLPGRVWESGKLFWSEDYLNEPWFQRKDIAKKAGLKFISCFPIIVKKEVVALMVFFNSEAPNQKAKIIDFVGTVNTQIGAAIRNKQIEEKLRFSEEQFRGIVENTPESISRFDKKGNYLFVNSALEKQLGMDKSKFIGKSISEVGWPEEIAKGWMEKISEVLKTKKEISVHNTFEVPSGIKFYFTKLVPEFGKNGDVKSILAITRDITDSGLNES